MGKLLWLFSLFVLQAIPLHAQEQDFQIWNNIEFTYKPIKKIELGFDNGVRLTENCTEISRYFFTLSVKRKHNNFLSYAAGYRYLIDRSFDPVSVEKKNRYYIDVYFKNPLSKRIRYSLRSRLQSQIDADFSFNQNVKNKLRQKVKLIYDIKNSNLDFFVGFEGFFLFYDSRNGKREFEKIRYQIGGVKPITKNINLNMSCIIQQEFTNPNLFFIIRTKWSYSF